MCVWDLLGGNRMLFRATSHQKTVTCLQVAAAAGADGSPRLLSASLDGLVKVGSVSDGPNALYDGGGETGSWCKVRQ